MRSGSETLGRMTRWGAAHPLATDGIFAILVGALTVLGYYSADVGGSERSQDVIGLLLIGVMTAGLVIRRRKPFVSLGIVLGSTISFWVADYPTNFDVFSVLTVYAVVAHGGTDRRQVWGVAGSSVVLLTAIAVAGVLSPSDDLPAAAIIGIAAIHLTAAVAGEIVHERRLRLAELEQRAVRAEAEREVLAREAVFDERARIARDLHDIVAHATSVMVVQAGAAQRVVDTQPERAVRALEDIQITGRQALNDMRRMLGVLRDADHPIELSPQPSIGELGEIVHRCVDAGVPTELIVEGERPVSAAGAELTSYRIVQEALTNVIKHAGRPAHAVVRVTNTADAIRVEVTDDGKGALTEDLELATGHGLIGMRERVELYGGRFRAGPRPGGGFRVWATIPYDAVRAAS